MRFLGVDLAWKAGHPSGVALLGGHRFPLHLREAPRSVATHAEVLEWIAHQVRRHRCAVGIDAPLLGTSRPGRRRCDDTVAREFGAFHASTHSPPRAPDLRWFTAVLIDRYGLDAFAPDVRPRSGRPAVREVYPNALQVRLFGLCHGSTIRKYKRRRFGNKGSWVENGLRPFLRDCAGAVAGRYVVADDAWTRFVEDLPRPSMRVVTLKGIEDRWDALLCALAVAIEVFAPGAMTYYSGGDWTAGAILAPVLQGISTRRPGAGGSRRRHE